jgi:acetone carboxylase, beta subunit
MPGSRQFPFSWRNPDHERRAQAIARNVIDSVGAEIPILTSVEVCPKRSEFARLNTMIIDAYAAEPSRRHLLKIRQVTKDFGAKFDLRVMASSGGTISIDAPNLVSTLVSGPIGGCVGARYLSHMLDKPNMACADIGGTSFDVALVVNGENEIRLDPDIAHFKMNLPMVKIDSVGAGTGSMVRINPFSKRIEIGPDSAGNRIGTSNPDGSVDTVTITDCDVVLGRLDPDYFLGGELQLDAERARRAIQEQVAEPLGLSVEQAASGVLELFEAELERQLKATVTGQGFGAPEFALLAYGGGGPVHVAGFSAGLEFEDVLVPTWAAGFSAFGCVCADYAYRLDRQLDRALPGPDASGEAIAEFASTLGNVWTDLRKKIVGEFAESGVAESDIRWRPSLRMQYNGQLNDIEIPVRNMDLSGPSDLSAIAESFETVYGQTYANAARSPEVGYFVTLAILTGSVDIEKPALAVEPLALAEEVNDARKAGRDVFIDGSWREAAIYDMDALRAGNQIVGPAVVEAPSTSFFVPPRRTATLDEHRIFHLQRNAERA